MKKFWGVVCLVAAIASVAAAQPVIRTDKGVLNASSYAADIARGSWFVIFGSGMGPGTISVYSGALPYPAALSGTSVSFTPAAGGTAIAARMWYTLAGQLAGMLPSTAAAGDYDVKVTYNGSTGAAYRVKVVERNFGYATQAQNGNGPAQATYGGLDLNRFTTGTLGQWSLRPAKPNDTMVLWGTGVGADANSDLTGGTSGDQKDAGAVKVVVGGIEVTPDYAGRSNGSPGLDQINFRVPGNVTPSCFVSLAVKAGGRTSNVGTIAIADAGNTSCTDPRYTASQLSRLDQGGTLNVGGLSLNKSTVKVSVAGLAFDSTTESVSGSFFRYGVDGVGSSGGLSITQIGACYIYHLTGVVLPSGSGTFVYLDAGPQLRLNGPNASNIAVPGATGVYSLSLYNSGFGGIGGSGAPTLAQGTYTLAGTGGADVGAFSTSLDFPGSFVWTNQGSLADPIPRSAGMPITWTGGGAGLVTITGVSAVQAAGGTETNPLFDTSLFICTTPAPPGNFTVPSSVLQQLSAVSADVLGSVGTLAVAAISDPANPQGNFTAPLTAGGTLDLGTFSYSIGTTKNTGWQ